ncbi:uncharacterized protein [Onthophagus taurus]|uniref:uncharacterized protein n=1 Tax=Onthophagus taurus TaxID=166361 RepID=UPI0039BDCD7A
MSSYITLNYGPYEAYGIIRHRPQRLHGLVEALTKRNFMVELIQTEHLNRLTIDIYGVTIFRCDIRNLLFNVCADNDVVCLRALDAIEEASKRIFSDTNVPKFVSVEEGMRFIEKRKHYGTADYLQTSGVELLFEIDEKEPDDPKKTRFKDSNVVVDSDMSLTEDTDVSSVASNLITVSDLNPDAEPTLDAPLEILEAQMANLGAQLGQLEAQYETIEAVETVINEIDDMLHPEPEQTDD